MIQVVTDLALFQKIAHEPLVVALGNFDGVHLGHQAILRQIQNYASQIKGKPAVLTFEQHPQRVLHKKGEPLLLTSFHQKLALLDRSGISLCFVEKFTPDFSKQSPERFVKEVLVDQLGARAVCMGFNAKFGHERSGNSETMQDLAHKFHFEFLEVKPVEAGHVSVSSTKIRSSVLAGDFEAAQNLLGRPFSIFGLVERGSGRGEKLGFPTANLRLESEVLPPYGVYAIRADLMDEQTVKSKEGFRLDHRLLKKGLLGVMNYGTRPTVDASQAPVAEVHLLGENQDFLGKVLEVVMVQRIRDEKKFEDVSFLASQIKEDIKVAKAIFSGKIPGLGQGISK